MSKTQLAGTYTDADIRELAKIIFEYDAQKQDIQDAKTETIKNFVAEKGIPAKEVKAALAWAKKYKKGDLDRQTTDELLDAMLKE